MAFVKVGDEFVRVYDGHGVEVTEIEVVRHVASPGVHAAIQLTDRVNGIVTWIDAQVFANGLNDYENPKYRRQR